MKIHRTLFDRKNLPILAVLLGLLGFWGIGVDSVKQVISNISNLIFPPSREELFFCTLESETVIRDAQGKVYRDPESSGNFDEGGCRPGFVSKENKDRATFPVDDNLPYFKAGTIELCLTPQREFEPGGENLFLFNITPDHNALILQIVDDNEDQNRLKRPSMLRLRMKVDGAPNSRVLSKKEVLEWKVDQHYHIAATWDETELNLYRDGKNVGAANCEHPLRELRGRFVVNRESTDPEQKSTPTHCIISNLVIHNAQLEPEDLGKKCPIRDHWHPEK